eukprot:1414423-Amphidinium_carterae.1
MPPCSVMMHTLRFNVLAAARRGLWTSAARPVTRTATPFLLRPRRDASPWAASTSSLAVR